MRTSLSLSSCAEARRKRAVISKAVHASCVVRAQAHVRPAGGACSRASVCAHVLRCALRLRTPREGFHATIGGWGISRQNFVLLAVRAKAEEPRHRK
eukprot:2320223-Pleurochrysis_carterae.AAC.2